MSRATAGMTLMEVLLASMVGLVVVLGVSRLDIARFQMHEELLGREGESADPGLAGAALAAVHIGRHLEDADRVNLLGPGSIQIRVPVGLTFDTAGDYQWDQYEYDGASNTLFYYSDISGGCGSGLPLAGSIGSVTFSHRDEGPMPPGGEPPANDSNAIEYAVEWDNGAGRNQIFRGQATLRSAAYTDVATGLQDPSLGDVSPPPGSC